MDMAEHWHLSLHMAQLLSLANKIVDLAWLIVGTWLENIWYEYKRASGLQILGQIVAGKPVHIPCYGSDFS